jgi:hypothetical protein
MAVREHSNGILKMKRTNHKPKELKLKSKVPFLYQQAVLYQQKSRVMDIVQSV